MSFRSPSEFETDHESLEAVEKATARFVAQAVADQLKLAADQFSSTAVQAGEDPTDKADYLCEDLTRMALDLVGLPRVPEARLFGAVDYKLAAYQFLPEFAVRQALFVDSKAEKNSLNNARVQIRQTSLELRQIISGQPIAKQGLLPSVATVSGEPFLTTTVFVKYHYRVANNLLQLSQISVITLPNGYLQEKYNPTAQAAIWNVGPNARSLGEKFRTRVNFTKLGAIAAWRVQRLLPGKAWIFVE